jgi:hypothetical protein
MPPNSCACRARVAPWRSNRLSIYVSCAMMVLRVSARLAWLSGLVVALSGQLSGVDMVIDAPVLEADTKLLRHPGR